MRSHDVGLAQCQLSAASKVPTRRFNTMAKVLLNKVSKQLPGMYPLHLSRLVPCRSVRTLRHRLLRTGSKQCMDEEGKCSICRTHLSKTQDGSGEGTTLS